MYDRFETRDGCGGSATEVDVAHWNGTKFAELDCIHWLPFMEPDSVTVVTRVPATTGPDAEVVA